MTTNIIYGVSIECAIDRPIKYDQTGNIIFAVVDYCFDNIDQLRKYLDGGWFELEYFTDSTPQEKINKKNSHIDEIITRMINFPNKLISSEKLSGNDGCCHYRIFQTDDKTKLRSFSRYLSYKRNTGLIEEYNVNDYPETVESTKLMLERKQKFKN
jgi:hypothetical protein